MASSATSVAGARSKSMVVSGYAMVCFAVASLFAVNFCAVNSEAPGVRQYVVHVMPQGPVAVEPSAPPPVPGVDAAGAFPSDTLPVQAATNVKSESEANRLSIKPSDLVMEMARERDR